MKKNYRCLVVVRLPVGFKNREDAENFIKDLEKGDPDISWDAYDLDE